LLTSSLTRVPGLVSIADVARTALQTPHALGHQRDGGPVATSYRLEDQIDVARGSTMPGSVLVLCLLVMFVLFFPRGAPTALGSALLARRFGALAFLAIGGLALATIAENALGSDGGGAIVVGVAFAVLAVELLGAPRRYILPALLAAAFVVFSLVNIDASVSG